MEKPFLSRLLSPLRGLIDSLTGAADELFTSDEERLQFRQNALEMGQEVALRLATLFESELETQRAIIVAEAQGESALQRNWRPITMLVFLFIIVYQLLAVPLFNLPPIEAEAIPDKLWDLLKLGIGGYIASRGLEKTVKNWKNGGS